MARHGRDDVRCIGLYAMPPMRGQTWEDIEIRSSKISPGIRTVVGLVIAPADRAATIRIETYDTWKPCMHAGEVMLVVVGETVAEALGSVEGLPPDAVRGVLLAATADESHLVAELDAVLDRWTIIAGPVFIQEELALFAVVPMMGLACARGAGEVKDIACSENERRRDGPRPRPQTPDRLRVVTSSITLELERTESKGDKQADPHSDSSQASYDRENYSKIAFMLTSLPPVATVTDMLSGISLEDLIKDKDEPEDGKKTDSPGQRSHA